MSGVEAALVDDAYEARRDGRRLTETAEISVEDGLRLQLAVADRFEQYGGAISGWKVGMTSGPMRDRLGEGIRPFGYLLADRTFADGDTISMPSTAGVGIEPELCLILGSPLEGDVSPEQAREAVAGVAPSFELLEFRTRGLPANPGRTILDGLANWGIVVGEPIPPRDLLEVIRAELFSDDDLLADVTAGRDLVLDDPFLSLSRLSSDLHRFGRRVEAGQVILTGALAKVDVPAAARYRAAFAAIGTVTADLEPID